MLRSRAGHQRHPRRPRRPRQPECRLCRAAPRPWCPAKTGLAGSLEPMAPKRPSSRLCFAGAHSGGRNGEENGPFAVARPPSLLESVLAEPVPAAVLMEACLPASSRLSALPSLTMLVRACVRARPRQGKARQGEGKARHRGSQLTVQPASNLRQGHGNQAPLRRTDTGHPGHPSVHATIATR